MKLPSIPYYCGLISLITTITLLSNQQLTAQSSPWTSLNGPNGGDSIYSIFTDDNNRTWLGGYDRGLFRSDDNGASWSKVSNKDQVEDYLITSSGRTFIAADDALYFSDDDGQTWTEAISEDGFISLEQDGNQLFAGSDGGSVYLSDDDGDSWVRSDIDTESQFSVFIWDLEILDNGTLLAATGYGLYETTLEDTVWTETDITSGGRNILETENKIFVDTFVSTDNGSSWTENTEYPGSEISHITQTADGNIYATDSPDTLYYSEDEGENWNGLSLDGLPRPDFRALGYDANGNIIAGLYESGAFIYDSSTESWSLYGPPATDVKVIYQLENGDLLVGTEYMGLQRFNQATQSWSSELSEFHPRTVGTIQEVNGKLMIGAGESLFTSSDGGSTWTENNEGYEVSGYEDLTPSTIFESASDGLFIGSEGAGIYHSEDGTSWTQINDGIPTGFNDYSIVRAFGENSNGTIYAAGGWNGLYTLDWSDSTWSEVQSTNDDVFKEQVYDIVEHPNGDLYASSYVLRDGSDTWEVLDVDERYVYEQLEQLAITSDGTIFISSDRDFLFRSDDNGATWSNITDELPDISINELFITLEGNLLAGTDKSGIYQKAGVTTSVNENDISVPNSVTLNQNYPNPFNPSTTLSFDLPSSSDVTLTIFNVLGQRVSTLINRTMAGGQHNVNFKADHLSSGIYLYQLNADGVTITKKMLLLK